MNILLVISKPPDSRCNHRRRGRSIYSSAWRLGYLDRVDPFGRGGVCFNDYGEHRGFPD